MCSWDEFKKWKVCVEIILMIDVMMFLLVFFVLISLNVILVLGLKIQLFSLFIVQDLKLQIKVVIIIVKEDVIQVDGENIILDVFIVCFDKLCKDGEKFNFIINSDCGVEVQCLVDVMDMFKKGGFDFILIVICKQ